MEDEASIREVIKLKLEQCGFTVETAGDGKDAIDVIAHTQSKFDLLITDAIMPIVSGKAVCQEFKNHFPESHMILMTGHAKEVIDQEFLDTNEVVLLGKPFSLDRLLKAIEQASK